MTLNPRNLMWAEACALLQRAEQLHRQFFEPTSETGRSARWEPPIDILETDSQLRIIVALPGVAPDAVHVQSEGGTLTVVGRRPLPSCDGNTKIVRLEIPYGSFERRIALQLNRLRLSKRELTNGCLVLTFVKLG